MCIVTTQINSTNNLVELHNSLLTHTTHTTTNLTSYGARLAPGICTWVWAKLNNNVHRVQTWNSIYLFCEPKLAIYIVPVWQQILTNESTSNITDEDGSGSPQEVRKVIVFMSSLLSLFSICREPNCGSYVERENMKVVLNGAMIRVHTLCNNHHSRTWDSSPMIGTGRKTMAVINILLCVYCLVTGLHIKQV